MIKAFDKEREKWNWENDPISFLTEESHVGLMYCMGRSQCVESALR